MREETESTHVRVYTMYGIQRHVWNQRSIPRIYNGAEEVVKLNSSVRGEDKSLIVLRRWMFNSFLSLTAMYVHTEMKISLNIGISPVQLRV
jgi:hypothetical protein